MKTPRQFQETPNKQPVRSEKATFVFRVIVAFVLVFLMFMVLFARFFYLQVMKHDDFVESAINNRVSLIPTPPIRGEIIDSNGIVLARNIPAFSLEIVPNDLDRPFDELVAILRRYVDISEADLKRYKKYREENRGFDFIPLKLKMDADEASRLAPELFRMPGVRISARTFREYPYGALTSHIIGYIGRISQKDLEGIKQENQSVLYRGTTHIGKTGLEKYYEKQLHGFPGFEEVEKDAQGNIVKILKTYPAKTGATLKLSLDIRMQKEADRLLGNQRGTIVALNPETGGVLAMVSKPSFDSNLFIDGIDTETWNSLNNDWRKPLNNRAIQGLFPPGSTFKPFVAMAALQSRTLGYNSIIYSPGEWSIPGSKHKFRDSVRSGHGWINMSRAIQVSSDTFFYQVAYKMGIDKLSHYLEPFGFGQKTGIDLPNEYIGVLPSREWKKKRFKRYKPEVQEWRPGDTISIGIGQGYNAYTPLQMAFATEILANNGKVYRPHLVQELIDHENKLSIILEPKPSRYVNYKASHFRYVKNAMRSVITGGTGRRIGQGLKYSMAGKTGTAQVVRIKQGARYNAAALALQHRDHAWFIAFAPVEKPKIVIAVILENGGWGSNAAPLARALSDYYINTLKAGKVKIMLDPTMNREPVKGKISPEEIRQFEAQGIPHPKKSLNLNISTAKKPGNKYKESPYTKIFMKSLEKFDPKIHPDRIAIYATQVGTEIKNKIFNENLSAINAEKLRKQKLEEERLMRLKDTAEGNLLIDSNELKAQHSTTISDVDSFMSPFDYKDITKGKDEGAKGRRWNDKAKKKPAGQINGANAGSQGDPNGNGGSKHGTNHGSNGSGQGKGGDDKGGGGNGANTQGVENSIRKNR